MNAPAPAKKGWTTGAKVGAVVTALFVAGMCRGAMTHTPPDTVAAAAEVPPPLPAAPAPETAKPAQVAKLGDTVTLSDSKWIVLKAEKLGSTVKSNNQFQPDLKSEGGFFVRVVFKITNLGKTEERLLSRPKLKDSQGREFNEVDNLAFFIPEGKKALMMEAIPPSLPKEFWSVYEVPADATGLRFMARELSITGETFPVDLALK